MSSARRPPSAHPTTQIRDDLEAASRGFEHARAVMSQDTGLLDAILNHSPHGIIVSDPHGKIVLRNRAADRIWAGTANPPGIADWGNYRAFHPDGRRFAHSDWAIARCLAAGVAVKPQEIRIQRFDDTSGVLLESCAPIFGDDGSLQGALSMFVDITEFKNQEASVALHQQRARSQSEASARAEALARAKAERSRLDAEQLFQFTAAINRAADIDAVYALSLRALCETLDVDRAAILLLDPDGVMRFKAWRGLSDRYRAAVEGHTPWSLDDPDPQPVMVRDAAADSTLAEFKDLFVEEDIRALAFIPLVDQRLWGKVMVYSREARAFTEHELAHAQAVASLVSQALARAQLLEAERWARGQAEAAQQRTAFLLEGSIALSSSLQFREALERLAHLAVPRFADWCSVDFAPEGPASTQHIALVHRDPAKQVIDEQLRELYPTTDALGNSLGNVVTTGKTQLYPEVTDDLLRSAARDPRHLELLRGLEIKSVMLVPMVARGRTFGVVTLVRSESGPPYGPSDLEIAELLGRRAGIAIDNALLYWEAQEVAEGREEILRVVSHDLRNPLSAIMSSASGLLTAGPDSLKTDRFRRALEIIYRGGQRMTRMIDDLLDAASIRAGRLSIRREPTDVGGIVSDAIESFSGEAQTQGVSIRTELPGDLPEVSVDRERIVQALSNLISNALNVVSSGSIVVVRGQHEHGDVILSVSDTGPGIGPDELPRVFDRYWRNSKRGGRGTGLGLSIAKGIVEAHGGRIWADSTVGAGSTFSFSFPVNIGREAATPA